MKKPVQRYLRRFAFDEQIFVVLMIFMALLASLLAIENMLIHYPFEANYKWFALLALALLALVFTRNRQHFNLVKTAVFATIIFGILPLGWLSSSINNSYTIAYSFLVLICIAFFFRGKARLFFMAGELAVIMAMLVLSLARPDMFLLADWDVVVVDFLVQVPLTYATAAVLLSTLMNAYHLEHDRLLEYAALLDAKNKELAAQAEEDDLTGIYNRRYIIRKLEELKQLGYQGHLAVAMVDIDGIKSINSAYGHAAGDRVIRQAAALLAGIVGSGGFIGRFGGDEFILVLYSGTGIALESTMEGVKELRIRAGDEGQAVRLSGGFVKCRQIDDVDRILRRADNLLMEARASGRRVQSEVLD